ncbi:MAG: ribosome silencing factor [Acidimicrobiales bacterium]
MSNPDPTPSGRPDPSATSLSSTSIVDHMDPRFPIVAARAAHAKGGIDILVLRVGDVLAITDYFVIVSASNARLVRTIVQDIEQQVAEDGGPHPSRIEGQNEAEWVLADFGAFVVHVFHTETRQYYELERLWSDVAQIDWVDPDAPGPGAPGSAGSGSLDPG